jgi:hypothetical protein
MAGRKEAKRNVIEYLIGGRCPPSPLGFTAFGQTGENRGDENGCRKFRRAATSALTFMTFS